MRKKKNQKLMYWINIQEMYFKRTQKVTPSRKLSWKEKLYWKIHFKLMAIKIRRRLRKSLKYYGDNFSKDS